MKHIFVYLSLISILFLASSCPKNDGGTPKNSSPQLPPATQTGANTFGCLLNGKVWISEGPGGLGIPTAQYYKGEFLMGASSYDKSQGINQTISFGRTSVYSIGTYYFKYAELGGPPSAEYRDFVTNCDYLSNNGDSLNTYVTITKLDSVKRIISGTFNLLFYPSGNECDTVKITNGRFDVVYTY